MIIILIKKKLIKSMTNSNKSNLSEVVEVGYEHESGDFQLHVDCTSIAGLGLI